MAAAVLARLGVPMGPDRDEVVFEDPEFNALLARRWLSRRHLRRLVAQRDRIHDLWGWKYPGTVRHLGIAIRALRAPHLVWILRDPLAIAAREHLATGAPLPTALKGAGKQLRALLRAIAATSYPALVVSHDKAVRAPEAFVDEVIGLLALAPAPEERAAAVAAIAAEPRAYLDHARHHTCQGHLDGVEAGVVWGWARDTVRAEPASVEIRVDGSTVAVVRAELPRSDLADAGFGDGCHGFRVALPDGTLTAPSHELRAVLVESDWELPGSPVTIRGATPQAGGGAP